MRERFGVDEDICTGDHACIRLSGCPSLSVKHTTDPLKDDPVAAIDNTCVGCGNCGEVAEAAVLCPSFYRADIIHNPTGFEARARRASARRHDRLPAALARRGGRITFGMRRHERLPQRPRHRAQQARPHHHRGARDGRPGRRRAGRLDRGAGRERRLVRAIDLGARRRPAHRRHDLLHRDDRCPTLAPAVTRCCR